MASASLRLMAILSHLRINMAELAKKLELTSNVKLSYIKTGRNGISADMAKLICLHYPQFDYNWVATGEGEMLVESTRRPQSVRNVIHYWPELAACGGVSAMFDPKNNGHYQSMVIPNFDDCTDAIPLVGDSMSPRYKSGQIVILKPWNESFIEYGQVYLVVTRNNHCTLRYIHPNDDLSKITLCSEDPAHYPTFDILRTDVERLYLIKGSIEQNSY